MMPENKPISNIDIERRNFEINEIKCGLKCLCSCMSICVYACVINTQIVVSVNLMISYQSLLAGF